MRNKKIRVGLLGLGRTGRIVANSLFKDPRFEFVFAVKKHPPKPADYPFAVETREVLPQLIQRFKPQIIIDFTTPEATLENLQYLRPGMGIVIATTGFSGTEIGVLKAYARRKLRKIKLLYAPNISDGINILMKACKEIYRLWPQADIEIIEQHFKHKKDKPSGTAKKIVKLFKKDITVHAVRAGGITGIHTVIFARPNQKIVISHESFSREVFAEGAKRAVLWLKKQRMGFYQMEDMYK